MELNKLLDDAYSSLIEEEELIEKLKKEDLKHPSSMNKWNMFYEKLNDYLLVMNLIDDESPYKNIDVILDTITSKKEIGQEEKKMLLKYSIYFSYSNYKLFEDMSDSDKISSFSQYLSYRYNKFVNVYNAIYNLTKDEMRSSIGEEMFFAVKKGLLKKEQMETSFSFFANSYGYSNSEVYSSFASAIKIGLQRIQIDKEKEMINNVISHDNTDNIENKKRL